MQYGRRYHVSKKMILLAVMTTIIFLLSYVSDMLQVIDAYGFSELNAPACSLPVLIKIHNISIGGYLLFMYMGRFFLALFASLIIYTLSRKNASKAMITASVIFIVPLILSFLSVSIVDYYPFNALAETNQILKISENLVIGLPAVMSCMTIVFLIFTIMRVDNCM